jgi:hypothetical protein
MNILFLSLSLTFLFSCSEDLTRKEFDQVSKKDFDFQETNFLKNKSSNIPLVGRWDYPPLIKVCNDVDIDLERLEKAIIFWRSLGYEIAGPIKDLTGLCHSSIGHIVIRNPSGQELSHSISKDHLATTIVSKWDFYPEELAGAEIYFQTTNSVKMKWVIEHEIGHALGWLHSSKSGHLMNSRYKFIGSEIDGISKELYDSATVIHKRD